IAAQTRRRPTVQPRECGEARYQRGLGNDESADAVLVRGEPGGKLELEARRIRVAVKTRRKRRELPWRYRNLAGLPAQAMGQALRDAGIGVDRRARIRLRAAGR